MADAPAAPLPRGSYFTEARIREVLRTSALRSSKKFAGPRKDVLFGQETLVLFLLHRVVDRLSHDLAVLDQVGVSPIPYPDVVVLVDPLQECHPSLDRCVGVLEGAMLGQLLTEHVRQLPYTLMTAESSPVYEDHNILRCVAADILLEAALEAYLAAPVFGQLEVVVEHFLGCAAAEVLHNATLLHIAEHSDQTKMLAREQARCIPRRVIHPSAWKGKFSEGRAGLRVVASCSSGAKVDSLSAGARRGERCQK